MKSTVKVFQHGVAFWMALLASLVTFAACQPSPAGQETTTAERDQHPTAAVVLQTVMATIEPFFTLTPIPILPTAPSSLTPRPTSAPAASPTSWPTPTATPAEPAPTLQTDPSTVHLAAVGDIMLARTLGEIIANGRPEYPFAAMGEELTGADFTIGNFESALGDVGAPQQGKSYPFRAPPGAAEALALGGFNLVSLANNHAMDYGPEALLQGLELLEAAGVASVGAGVDREAAHAPHIVTINGQRLAFLAYVNVPVEVGGFDVASWEATTTSPGLAWGRAPEIAADIAAVQPTVDHVIILLHSGLEYVRFTGDVQRELARAAIDAGAALVIGHHAHILQGIERYKGGVIAYGLGNFAFDINGDPDTAVLHLWLHPDGKIDFELRPAVIQKGGAPRPATFEEDQAILKSIEGFVPAGRSVER